MALQAAWASYLCWFSLHFKFRDGNTKGFSSGGCYPHSGFSSRLRNPEFTEPESFIMGRTETCLTFFRRFLDSKQTYPLLRRKTLSLKTVHYLIHPRKDILDKSSQCLHLKNMQKCWRPVEENCLPTGLWVASLYGCHRVHELNVHVHCLFIFKLHFRSLFCFWNACDIPLFILN